MEKVLDSECTVSGSSVVSNDLEYKLNILRLCYQTVRQIDSHRYLVQKVVDGKYTLIDELMVTEIETPFTEIEILAGVWFGRVNCQFYEINPYNMSVKDDTVKIEYDSYEKIGNGAYLLSRNCSIGILGASGEMLTPFLYFKADVVGYTVDGIKINVGYRCQDSAYSVSSVSYFDITVAHDGCSVDRLMVQDICLTNETGFATKPLVAEVVQWENKSKLYKFDNDPRRDIFTEDTWKTAKFKYRLRDYNGCVGTKLYDGFILNSLLANLKMGMAYNVAANGTKSIGIVGVNGIEYVPLGRYSNVQFMGNGYFLGKLMFDTRWELIKDNEVISLPKECMGHFPNNPVAVINLIWSDGTTGFMRNDFTFSDTLLGALEIYKYVGSGNTTIKELNRINLYGSKVYVDNNFTQLDGACLEVARKAAETDWCLLNT